MGACPSLHTDRPSLNKPPHSQGGGQQTGAGGESGRGGGGGQEVIAQILEWNIK